jgi:nickel-dependent lactate racemase
MRQGLIEALDKLGPRKKVLVVPPDFTRFHSRAGELTCMAAEYYGDALRDVLPALGTHSPMTDTQKQRMFPGLPNHLFREHNWRTGVTDLGTVPSEFIAELTDGKVDFAWTAQVDELIAERHHDLILSIGQIVPHEVMGMANYNKNILIGAGGQDTIDKSHYLSAVIGVENILGRAINPVRRLLNHAEATFMAGWPIVYVHTVLSRDESGKLVVRGLFIGDDQECFTRAAMLSLEVNVELLDRPQAKIIVYLDPDEFKSTWLGNKSVYRTRLAMADGGELIVLAPGVREFGEDSWIDHLIRKYGYQTTPEILKFVEDNEDLQGGLSAAAHLMQSSSEDRFTITYCPGLLTREEVESVNYAYADLDEMSKRYDPAVLKQGFNTMPDGEEIYFIENPALGLWAHVDRF